MLKSGTYTQLAPILFGNGCAGQAGEAVGNLGCKKVLLVSDEGVLAAGAVETVKKALLGAGIQVIVWAEAQTDCPEDTVKAAAAIGRNGSVDGVVGVGGGSVLDTAKAVSAVIPNDDQVLDDIVLYLSGQKNYANQPLAVEDGTDMEARDRLAFASNIAGISFNESGVHIGHSAAHALGHLYHIPHGVCCANMTPAIIKFAAKTYPEKMKKLGNIMGAKITSDDPEVIGTQAADAVRKFAASIGVKTFKELGLSKDQVLAAKPMFYGDPLCMAFGGEVTEQDVTDILTDAYEG